MGRSMVEFPSDYLHGDGGLGTWYLNRATIGEELGKVPRDYLLGFPHVDFSGVDRELEWIKGEAVTAQLLLLMWLGLGKRIGASDEAMERTAQQYRVFMAQDSITGERDVPKEPTEAIKTAGQLLVLSAYWGGELAGQEVYKLDELIMIVNQDTEKILGWEPNARIVFYHIRGQGGDGWVEARYLLRGLLERVYALPQLPVDPIERDRLSFLEVGRRFDEAGELRGELDIVAWKECRQVYGYACEDVYDLGEEGEAEPWQRRVVEGVAIGKREKFTWFLDAERNCQLIRERVDEEGLRIKEQMLFALGDIDVPVETLVGWIKTGRGIEGMVKTVRFQMRMQSGMDKWGEEVQVDYKGERLVGTMVSGPNRFGTDLLIRADFQDGVVVVVLDEAALVHELREVAQGQQLTIFGRRGAN